MKRSTAARRQIIGAVAAVLMLGACDSPTDSGREIYTLTEVNAQALPAPYPDAHLPPDVYEVTEGRLTLNPNGSMVLELRMRCKPEQPAGSQCQVEADGRQSINGVYSRMDGTISFGGRTYLTTFMATQLVVHVVVPASEGLFPAYVLTFQR